MTAPQTPDPAARPDYSPDAFDRFVGWLRGLGVTRRTEDKWFAGVASGVADRLRVDPVVIRAGLVLLSLLFGVGIAAYLVAWSLLPDRNGRIAAERAIRHGDGGSIVLLIFTALAVFGGFPWWFDGNGIGWGFPWALLVVAGVVWWVIASKRRHMTPAERAEWDRRAGRWGEDVGNRVEKWGEQVGEKAERIGQKPDQNAGTGAPADPFGQPTGARTPATPSDTVRPEPAYPAYGAGSAAAYGSGSAPAVVVAPQQNLARRRSGGFLMSLVALGLILVTYGSTSWLADRFDWPGDHTAIALYASLGALGLLILAIGLKGWRTGFVGFLAVVTAVLAFLSLSVPSITAFAGPTGDISWAPTQLTAASTNYRLGAGEGRLDLTQLPADGLDGKEVQVSVGLGELTIVVPNDVTVDFRGDVVLGELIVPGATEGDQGGAGLTERRTYGTGSTELIVDANVGMGQLTVELEPVR